MKINRGNYETFLIEKLEGQLSTEQNAEVDLFLHSNPDIMQEWEAFGQTLLVPDETIVYEHKNLLKKKVGAVVPMYRSILYVTSLAASLLLLFFVSKKIFFTPQNQIHPVEVALNNSPRVNENSSAVISSPENSSTMSSNNSSSNNTVKNSTADVHIQFADNSLSQIKNNSQVQNTSVVNQTTSDIQQMQPNSFAALKSSSLHSYANYIGAKGVRVSSVPEAHRVSEAGAWMQVASILGAELVRLSGRGDLVNQPAPLEIQIKNNPIKKQVEETYSRIHKFLPFIHKKKLTNK